MDFILVSLPCTTRLLGTCRSGCWLWQMLVPRDKSHLLLLQHVVLDPRAPSLNGDTSAMWPASELGRWGGDKIRGHALKVLPYPHIGRSSPEGTGRLILCSDAQKSRKMHETSRDSHTHHFHFLNFNLPTIFLLLFFREPCNRLTECVIWKMFYIQRITKT